LFWGKPIDRDLQRMVDRAGLEPLVNLDIRTDSLFNIASGKRKRAVVEVAAANCLVL
jgi:hypothetical protein